MSDERVRLESHRHVIVLAGSLVRAAALAAAGAAVVGLGWPVSLGGPPLLALAAGCALLAVWRWERTRVVVTTRRLVVVHGIVHRCEVSAPLGPIEIERTVPGRLLGYRTLVAGELSVPYVPAELARRLAWRLG